MLQSDGAEDKVTPHPDAEICSLLHSSCPSQCKFMVLEPKDNSPRLQFLNKPPCRPTGTSLSDLSLGVRGALSRHPVTWGDPEAEQILGNKMLIQPATQAVTDGPSKTRAFQNSEECSPRVCANDSKANYGSSDLTKADFLRWPSEGSNGHS